MMPQFEPSATSAKLDDIARGFLQFAEFSCTEESVCDGINKSHNGWTRDSERRAAKAVRTWLKAVPPRLIERAERRYESVSARFDYTPRESIGHDLCFSLSGAGTGFWDRESPVIRSLSNYTPRGEVYVWRGRNGKLNLELSGL